MEGVHARFTMILARGVVVAEQFSGGSATTATKLVAPEHSPTYALESGSSCWRRLPGTDPQALTDIGEQVPEISGATSVASPMRTPAGWILIVTGHQTTARLAINAETLRVDSITASAGGRSIVEHLQTLNQAPRLYSPSPACAS